MRCGWITWLAFGLENPVPVVSLVVFSQGYGLYLFSAEHRQDDCRQVLQ